MKQKMMAKLSRETKATYEALLNGIFEYQDTFRRLEKGLTRFEMALSNKVIEGEANELEIRRLVKKAKGLLKLCQGNSTEVYVPYCVRWA